MSLPLLFVILIQFKGFFEGIIPFPEGGILEISL